jgi:hypothetical protein
MRSLCLTFIVIIAGAGFCRAADGPEPLTPARIIAHADRARGNVKGVIWSAEIQSIENGRRSQRSLVIKNRGTNALAEITGPAKFKGQKLLMLDRNMWFIKPGLRKPVPISPRQKLMGSASNGDIASTNYAQDYEATPAGEDVVNDEVCYLFNLSAINPKATYDRIRYWISKERLLGVKAEFYTVSGKLLKTATFKYDNQLQNNRENDPFISEMIIYDGVIKEDVTTLRYGSVLLKTIPDSDFNLNLLLR